MEPDDATCESVLTIRSTDGRGRLDVFDLEPASTSAPVEYFHVRLFDEGLQAQAMVYAGMSQDLTFFLADLAVHWAGWSGKKSWKSMEPDLTICCTNDGRGHIEFEVELRSGLYPRDWHVRAVIPTEVGQLEKIAREAVLFFNGRSFR